MPQALTTIAVPPTVALHEMATPEEMDALKKSLEEAFASLPDLEAWKAEYRASLAERMEGATEKAQAQLDEIRAEIRAGGGGREEARMPCVQCEGRAQVVQEAAGAADD